MILNSEKLTYKIKGLNFKKFLTLLKKENIEVFNFKRCEYNLLFITIKKQDEKSFLQVTKKLNYVLEEIKDTLFLTTQKKIKGSLSFFLTIVFLIISVVFSCNMVYKTEVFGLQNISKQEIIKVLNDNNIKMFKTKSNYNLDDIELLLKTKIKDISFASAIIQGNTLIINIDEKINNDKDIYDYKPMVAPYDCIIQSISLKSGTAVVSVGQTVKKGQELVLPYINYKDGTKLNVEALAEVKAYVEVSNTTEYMENHTELIRSGRTQTFEEYSIFNYNFSSLPKTKFEKYTAEVEKTYPFKNFIVPIQKKKTIYYELIEKNVFVPFDKVKQNIIEQNKKILYNKFTSDIDKDREVFSTIAYEDNIYFVTTYLKTYITF